MFFPTVFLLGIFPKKSRPKRGRAPIKASASASKKRVNEKSPTESKRAHRKRLVELAKEHWERTGGTEREAYMKKVRTALEAEGFRHTPFQWRHKGHSFGLVKDLGDRQIHVRVYEDGIVDAEVEIHKRYLQHLYSPRPSAHRQVQRIFSKHGIPLQFVNEHYLPQVGATRKRFPKRLTKVSHVVGGVASVVGGLVAVSMARFVLRRRVRRRL